MADQCLLPVAITKCHASDCQQRHEGNHQPTICARCDGSKAIFVFVHFVVFPHFLPPQALSYFLNDRVLTSASVHGQENFWTPFSPHKCTLLGNFIARVGPREAFTVPL